MTAAKPADAVRRPGRPAVGRTAPLELEEILARALTIVREEGRDALSMRRLSKDLGVTPMAIYHHVPDKPALMNALLERVWSEIANATLANLPADPVELIVEGCVRTRDVWLRTFDLANLAVAVVPPDDSFFRNIRLQSAIFEAAGFPDVPLACSAVQNFTMGAIQTAANRRAASAYFGRDPKAVLATARRLLTKRDASSNVRGIVEGRFDEGDDRNFEPALRALIAGLLLGEG